MSSAATSIPITYYSWFPGEDFLAAKLPDYEKERQLIVYKIVASVILFIFVLPYFLATKKVPNTSNNDSESESNKVEHSSKDETQPSSNKKRRNKRSGKKDKKPTRTIPLQSESRQENEVIEFSPTVSNALTLTCIILIFAILFSSDNNLFPARTVITAPLFTKEECQQIIDMAHAAAQRNAESAKEEKNRLLLDLETTTITTEEDEVPLQLRKLDSMLKEPSGWNKDRHTSHPTTDLNVLSDPFTPKDRAWLANKLNGRLGPLVERSFGIFRGAIRANDIFVVRYDATNGQTNLRKHTDSSHISFNVLLNDDFEGGGTRFHSREDSSHIDVHPDVGEVLLSNAAILHEGLATNKGTRYILVGFDSIDSFDPLTGERTNLSLFSSWLNFSWMQIRFKEGFQDGSQSRLRILNDVGDDLAGEWKYSRYAVGLFSDLNNAMTKLIDMFAQFRSLKVVAAEDSDKYIQAMDQAVQQRNQTESKLGIVSPSRGVGYASWFLGQQIELDVLGNFKGTWNSRQDLEDKFRGENL